MRRQLLRSTELSALFFSFAPHRILTREAELCPVESKQQALLISMHVHLHITSIAAGWTIEKRAQMCTFYFGKPVESVAYYDAELKKKLVFLTNNFELDAIDIANIYKHRWSIELFFKWMKCHLYLKSFWGHSANAVKIQIYTSVIAFTLIAIIRQQLKTRLSSYEMLQIWSVSLFDKTQINQLLQAADYNNDNSTNDRSLQISLF